ncbi:hypothetical protein D1007_25468 [Hordeum vulgare]|nr:hypothetical protein D1007_25468 [Hordeum vulgare]
MCSEPTSLAVLMAKADKYATADSAMRVKVTASDKAVPTPATPKPAGDGRGGQNNHKRKADQMDSHSNSKLVAIVEGKTSAPQVGPPWKHSNRNNANWLPKQSFEQLLDVPCKIHSGAQPSNHTLQQCSFACRLSQGDGLPAPPVQASLAPPATPATSRVPAALAMPTPIAAPAESMMQAPSAPPAVPATTPVPATLAMPTPIAAPTITTTPAPPCLESCRLETQWVDIIEVDDEPAATAAPETPRLESTTDVPPSAGL